MPRDATRLRRNLIAGLHSTARLLDPRVGGRDQDAQADAASVVVAELPERDRLLVAADLARDVGGDIAALHPALGVPDRDRVRVVLVVGLGHEREPATGRERVV